MPNERTAESLTPRTDEAYEEWRQGDLRWDEFARTLERELAKARAKAEFWERDSMNQHHEALRLGDQRDASRA